MRFQVQEMARAERMLTRRRDRQRGRHVQRADPGARRAVGHAVHRAHRRRRPPRVAPEAGRASSSTCGSSSARGTGHRVEAVPKTRSASPATTSRRPSTTSSSLSPPSSSAQLADGSGPDRRRPSRVPGLGRAQRRAARRARRRLRGVSAVQIRVPAARPRPAAPPPAAHRRRRVRPPRARADVTLAAGGGRALVPTGPRRRDPLGVCGLRAAPFGTGAQVTGSRASTRPASSTRSTAGSSRCCS